MYNDNGDASPIDGLTNAERNDLNANPWNVVESSRCGSRPATRVIVSAPQGSRYDGRRGIVVRRLAEQTVLVRLDNVELPFGLGELREIE